VRLEQLRGRRYGEFGSIGRIACTRSAAAICQGGAAKQYAHTEANEDSVLLAEGNFGVLLAVADAHGGATASEVAIDWLSKHCAERWTCSDMDKNNWTSEALDCFSSINKVVLGERAEYGHASQTTLVLCLANLTRGFGLFASAGDSLAFLLGPRGVQSAFDVTPSGDFFLGSIELTLDSLCSNCVVSTRHLEDIDAIILASDGISKKGIGFEEPSRAILDAMRSMPSDLAPQVVAMELADRIVEAARRVQKQNRSGDNISVACAVVSPLDSTEVCL